MPLFKSLMSKRTTPIRIVVYSRESYSRWNFRGGTVPHSAFGYFVVGTNQSYKKFITSMSDDVSDNSFRANVHYHTVLRPGETILYPPAYLLSLYVQAVERQHSKDSDREYSYDLENCLRTETVSREQQDMAVLSLQLIVLRFSKSTQR